MNPTSSSPVVRPLILTAGLDPEAQSRLEQERRRYYPASLNRIPAHLSLFHALPGEELTSVTKRLQAEARSRTAFAVQIEGLKRLGRGTAYSIRSPQLEDLHRSLRTAWLPRLSRQDQQPFRPHVVIQNKVDPNQARELYEKLAPRFRPWQALATGLMLWRYEGGPWSPAAEFAFTKDTSVDEWETAKPPCPFKE